MDLLDLFRGIEDLVSDGRKLRTAIRVDDLGHDVAAESRSDLNKIGILFHLQFCTVGCKPGMESCGNSRCQAASDVGGAYQDAGRLDSFDEVRKAVRISFDIKILQLLMFIDKDFIDTIG